MVSRLLGLFGIMSTASLYQLICTADQKHDSVDRAQEYGQKHAAYYSVSHVCEARNSASYRLYLTRIVRDLRRI